jgi:hypothetical protein
MVDSAKLTMLHSITGETDDSVLDTYLKLAADKILARAYPFRTDITEVPDKYAILQVDIASYLYNKRGAEGETYHSENGINRSYEAADVPDSYLSRVIPFAGVIK